MEPWMETVLTIFASVMASGGLWAFIQHLLDKKSAKNRMILGLGHDRIIWLCMKYIDRGYITKDEFEDLNDYLYVPYRDMGGNGTAERLMKEVSTLPVKNITHIQHLRIKSESRGFWSRLFGGKENGYGYR